MRRKEFAIFGAMVGLILNGAMQLAANALTISSDLNQSAINLVNNVLGEGITANSASRTGTVYSFSDGAGTFGIDSGIVLDSSGRVAGANDADLASLMDYDYGGHTSTLEFELTSTGTLLNFNYVFASREFDQAVKFNDVFGLFVSVNGSAYENIALIERNDGTEVPVTINNLRAGVTGTEAPSSFNNYPVVGRQYSLFKGASVSLNEKVDGISNVFTAFKEVSIGDTVKVKFAIADVSDQKYDSYVMIEASSLSFEAPGARPNYFTENLYNLDPETTYVITLGGVDYTITTDENGETPIVTDDYDLFGRTIQITKVGLGQTAQTLKIAARPDPPEPVEGPDENYVLPETLVVTETSITVTAEEGQQYRIDDETTWRDADENGVVVFSGLTPNVPHTVYTRYAATENHPVSYSSLGTEISTLRSLDYSVLNYYGLYDGLSHSAEATSEVGTTYYAYTGSSDDTFRELEFSLNNPVFTEVGKYPVYFLIKADGYYSVYGKLSVEIVEWEYNLSVSSVSEVSEIAAVATSRERVAGYFEGVLNKTVDGEAVERVYSTDEPRRVEARTEMADGEYEVIVLAEDGTTARVSGTVSNGVLTFSTNEFGKYGVVVPLPEMVEGVDYTVSGWEGRYDGLPHSITVVSDGEVTYSNSLLGEYGSEVPQFIEPGEYKTYFRVEKDGYVTAYGEAGVKIAPLEVFVPGVDYIVEGYEGYYDGLPHSVTVTGEEITVKYMDENGDYTLDSVEFSEPGSYEIRYQVEREGYETAYDVETVEIIPLMKLDYGVEGWSGLYDGELHSGSVTGEGATVKYKDENGEYTLDTVEFSEPGSYEVEYVISREHYETEYGSYTVEIIDWKTYLTVEDATNSVTFEEMSAVKNVLLSSEEVLAYIDVNYYKQIGEEEPFKIHETEEPIMVEIPVDEYVIEPVVGGTYSVVRLHEGVAEKLAVEVIDGVLRFETDRFSLYALARPVVSQEIDEPMPEVDPLGEIAEVPVVAVVADTSETSEVSDASSDVVPDTGVATKSFAVAVVSFVPGAALMIAFMMFVRRRKMLAVRRRAQAEFYRR